MSLLAARRLSKSFGAVRALVDVSFDLSPGERVAMIGPNGAGKTTCFNILTGQLRPDTGGVFFQGDVITGLAPFYIARLGIARTFQIASVFVSLTVRENLQIALASQARRFASLARTDRLFVRPADDLLHDVGLFEQGDRSCRSLAYADLKRLELAIALAVGPRVLLLDEPAAGLAAGERATLMALVSRLVQEEDIALIFIEHDIDMVFAHADRVLVLNRGAIIAQGPPAAVRADRAAQAAYLGAPAPDA